METTRDERDDLLAHLDPDHNNNGVICRAIRDADRLATIERDVGELLEALGEYPKALDDPLDVENVRNRLRAMLDPEKADGS